MNPAISPREMQVAELLAWGFINKEISRQLFISGETVKTHRKNIYEKLHLHNLADLTRWYFAETKDFNYGMKPILKKILVAFFLTLTFSIEYFHIDAMRSRTVRAKTEILSRTKGRRKKKNIYQYI